MYYDLLNFIRHLTYAKVILNRITAFLAVRYFYLFLNSLIQPISSAFNLM